MTIQTNAIGASFLTTSTVATFGLGTHMKGAEGDEWIYVQANGAITGAGYVSIIDETYQAAMVSTSNDVGGEILGVAGVAFADNDYGWLQIKGPCVVRVAASCAANVRLNTTATAGQMDDDGTAGAFASQGIFLTTANGGAAATAAGFLNYPALAMPAL